MLGFGFGLLSLPFTLPDSRHTFRKAARKEVGKDAGCQDNVEAAHVPACKPDHQQQEQQQEQLARFIWAMNWLMANARIDASQAAKPSKIVVKWRSLSLGLLKYNDAVSYSD